MSSILLLRDEIGVIPLSKILRTPLAMSSTPPIIPKKRSLVECLDDVCRLREHEQQIMDDVGVSPMTKDMILNRIKEEKKKVITKAASDSA